MPVAEIPNWIRPADPAAHMAQGLQIGSSIGARQAQQAQAQAEMQMEAHKQELEQAKQEFYQQQSLKQQQLEAQKDARAQIELGLQAAAAARKSQAMLQYQQAVQSGTDPLKALLDYGPQMGQPVTAAASAYRALNAKPATNAPMPITQTMEVGDKKVPYLVEPKTGIVRFPPNATFGKPDKTPDPVRMLSIIQTAQSKLQTEHDKDDLGAMAATKSAKEQKPAEKGRAAIYNARQQKIDAYQKQLDNLMGQVSPEKGVAPTVSAKSKVNRARELKAQHPDWTKPQVIEAVNKEFSNAGGSQTSTD